MRQNNQREFGSLAGGIGVEYDPAGPLSTALALGVRWNTNDDAFSEAGSGNEGNAGVSGQVSWTEENLKAKLTLGAILDQPDTSGLYRIAGMEEESRYIDIHAGDSFISEAPEKQQSSFFETPLTDQNRAPLVYRNYRESNLLTSSLHPIEWSGAEKIASEEGPYPVWDNSIKREVLAAEFSLDNEKLWTGFQSPLGDDHNLHTAEQIDIPIRLYGFNTDLSLGDFDVKVQFGTLKDQDNRFGENPEVIVTETIYSAGEIDADGNIKVKPVVLNNIERGQLKHANYMRVLIDGKGNSVSGRILFAPPVVWGASFRPIEADNSNAVSQSSNVSAKEMFDNDLRSKYASLIDKLHPNNVTQRVLNVAWKEGSTNTAYGVDTRIPWIPLINYDTLSFFVKGPETTATDADETDKQILQNAEVQFHITQGPAALNASGKTRLKVIIPGGAFTPGEWSKVEVEYNGSSPEVRVSGVTIDKAIVSYNPNQEHYNDEQDNSGQQSYMILFIKPEDGKSLPAGQFSADEIILENSISSYKFNAGASVDWRIPGVILSIGNVDILEDVSIQSNLESAFRTSPEHRNIEPFAGLLGYSKIAGTILDTLLSLNFRINADSRQTTWNAGYEIDRSFGPVSFNNHFQTGSGGESLLHELSLGLAPTFGVTKVEAGIETSAEYEDMRLDRIWETYAGFKPFDGNNSGIRADFYANWLSYNEEPDGWTSSFGDGWLRSWEAMLPDAGKDADRRNAKLSISGTVDTKPVGANIYLEGESIYNKVQSTTLSNSTVRLELPFMIGKINAMFRLERGFNWGLNRSGTSFYDDSQWFMNSLQASAPLWASIPLYSLFDPSLYDSMKTMYDASKWNAFTENSLFHDLTEIHFQIPQMNGLPSFFIPSAFNMALKRNLHQKLDTLSDVLNLNASIDFAAVNLFGAFGSTPIMKFYQSDEFSNRLEGSIAFPRGEDISWQFLMNQNMSFFGFTEAVLILDNTLTFTDSGWSESLKIDWLVPTKKSLLSVFYSFLMGKALGLKNFPALSEIAAQPFSQLRNETLELSISEKDDELVMNLDLRHESIIRLEGRLYFSVFAELSALYHSATEILSFIGTIGTMLNISF